MLLEISQPRPVFGLGPRVHGAIGERQSATGNHAVHVEIDSVAEALASRAGAEGRVEAEQDGLGNGELEPAGLALEFLVEAQLPVAGSALEDQFPCLAIANLDGVDEALVHIGPDSQAIDQKENG